MIYEILLMFLLEITLLYFTLYIGFFILKKVGYQQLGGYQGTGKASENTVPPKGGSGNSRIAGLKK